MSSAIVNIVAKRVLKDAALKNINAKDPYFEEVKVLDRHGNDTGKIKKQKKGIPAGISAHDAEVLKSVRRKAYRLDMSLFNCCGVRFGWSSVIGIIPVIGDVIDALFALLVVNHARKIEGGLPPMLKSRMMLNVVLDFAVGLVPFLGDIADAVFRANTRNAWILEDYLIKKAAEEHALRTGTSHLDHLTDNPNKPLHETMGERQASSGGGVGGFFSGLFGGGKKADEEVGTSHNGAGHVVPQSTAPPQYHESRQGAQREQAVLGQRA